MSERVDMENELMSLLSFHNRTDDDIYYQLGTGVWDPNAVDSDGFTPLMSVCLENFNVDIINTLIRLNTDVGKQNQYLSKTIFN